MYPLGQTLKNVQSNSWHAIKDAVANVFAFVCIGYYAMIICIFQLFWITKIDEICQNKSFSFTDWKVWKTYESYFLITLLKPVPLLLATFPLEVVPPLQWL